LATSAPKQRVHSKRRCPASQVLIVDRRHPHLENPDDVPPLSVGLFPPCLKHHSFQRTVSSGVFKTSRTSGSRTTTEPQRENSTSSYGVGADTEQVYLRQEREEEDVAAWPVQQRDPAARRSPLRSRGRGMRQIRTRPSRISRTMSTSFAARGFPWNELARLPQSDVYRVERLLGGAHGSRDPNKRLATAVPYIRSASSA